MTEGEEGILWLSADAVKKARCEEGCLQTPPHYLKPRCFHGHHNGQLARECTFPCTYLPW